MLNYIWAALIFFGISAALISDLRDSNADTYRKGQFLTAYYKPEGDALREGKKIPAIITVPAGAAQKFYSKEFSKDLVFKSQITVDTGSTVTAVLFTGDEMPAIIKTIAKSSGKSNDINSVLRFQKSGGADREGSIEIQFEDISFVKMNEVTSALLEYVDKAVTLSIGLVGIMAFWLGIMKIAEGAGVISMLSKALSPIIRKIFPDVPKDHPAIGAMIMNISANILGLGNAATPFGLKAMEELDKINPVKGTATNAMCMFLTINTAGMTLIPATAIALRAAAGSSEPSFIIGTSLFGSGCATVMGIIAAKIFENFPLRGKSFFSLLRENSKLFLSLLFVTGVFALLLNYGGSALVGSSSLRGSSFKTIIQFISVMTIPALIVFFITLGFVKKVKVYEQFIEGAKEGFTIAIKIIPYLVAMLGAIGIFRAGGAMEWLVYSLRFITDPLGMPAEALPMALMRPLSGSGSLAVMAEIMSFHGPDSFIGKLVSTFYGSSETTFYVLAVYFGSVQIKKTRHALAAGLIADIAGMLGALFIVRMLFR